MAPEYTLVFGPIRGVPIGRRFADRKALKASGVHGNLAAGIYGRKEEGASSVILSGGYDDEDHGTHFTYIGSGGRESGVRFGPQTEDQSWDNNFNLALRMSARLRKPVRVTRGSRLTSKYAPASGYRYDGLYTASNPHIEEGPHGLKVCKFDFQRCPGQLPLPSPDAPALYDLTDIEIRRREYIEYRNTRDRSHEASQPQAEVEATSDFGDDEDEDDPFGDIEDIEHELEPVERYLDMLQAAETAPRDRVKAIVAIGRRVLSVLETKAQQGTDEAGRDSGWWYNELWGFVGGAMPKKPNEEPFRPRRVEEMYQNQEKRMRRAKEKRSTSTSTE